MADDVRDARLYGLEPGWMPLFNARNDRLYCHRMRDGDDRYHLIAISELYIARDLETLCVNCAVARGALTFDRPNLRRAAEEKLVLHQPTAAPAYPLASAETAIDPRRGES